jgi:hypothetical protein
MQLREKHRFRPRVEAMESRYAPAVVWPTTPTITIPPTPNVNVTVATPNITVITAVQVNVAVLDVNVTQGNITNITV